MFQNKYYMFYVFNLFPDYVVQMGQDLGKSSPSYPLQSFRTWKTCFWFVYWNTTIQLEQNIVFYFVLMFFQKQKNQNCLFRTPDYVVQVGQDLGKSSPCLPEPSYPTQWISFVDRKKNISIANEHIAWFQYAHMEIVVKLFRANSEMLTSKCWFSHGLILNISSAKASCRRPIKDSKF